MEMPSVGVERYLSLQNNWDESKAYPKFLQLFGTFFSELFTYDIIYLKSDIHKQNLLFIYSLIYLIIFIFYSFLKNCD